MSVDCAIDRVLDRLSRVKKTGADRWVARCPAHDDGRPSLAVTEKPDGMILLHCFAGCHINAIVEEIGLTLADLFPVRSPGVEPIGRRARPFNSSQAIDFMAAEALIAAAAAARVHRGDATEDDYSRLWLAANRLTAAHEVIHGRH